MATRTDKSIERPGVGVDGTGLGPYGKLTVWYTYFVGVTKLNPTVIVTQPDQTSSGFGSSFGGGFNWDGGVTSYPYGGDVFNGGADYDSGGGSHVCNGGNCWDVKMQ